MLILREQIWIEMVGLVVRKLLLSFKALICRNKFLLRYIFSPFTSRFHTPIDVEECYVTLSFILGTLLEIDLYLFGNCSGFWLVGCDQIS